MSDAMRMLLEFHRLFELPMAARPTLEHHEAHAEARFRMQDEELVELWDALKDDDLVAIADALADIVYVAYGTALTYGIDLDVVLRAVHQSNLTKLGVDGRPLKELDGKVIKGPNYRPPAIAEALSHQSELYGRRSA